MSLSEDDLARFEKELQKVLESIHILLDSQKSMEKPINTNHAAPGDGAGAIKVLHSLKKALSQYELKAVEVQFDLLKSVFSHPLIDEIRGHIASFDYDHALENTERLISILEENP